MRNQPVDLRQPSGRPFRALRRATFSSTDDGQLEHRLAVHVQERAAGDRAAVHVARRAEDVRRGCRRRAARWPARPVRSDACRMTAPAPSPNSTQVVRSLKSRMREKVSAPITSAVRCAPLRMKAVGRGDRVGETASRRPARRTPRRVLDAELVLQRGTPCWGNTKSGVEVATMIRSMSCGSHVRPLRSRFARRCTRQIAGCCIGVGEVARMDAACGRRSTRRTSRCPAWRDVRRRS